VPELRNVERNHPPLRMGIDVGSTTAKIVALDSDGKVVHADYRRHNADTSATLSGMIDSAAAALGGCSLPLAVTGSAGLGLARDLGLPF